MGGRRVAGKNGGEVDLNVGGGEGVVIGDADGSLRKLSGRVRWERRKGTNLSGQLDIQLIWLLLPGKPDLARTERLVGRDFRRVEDEEGKVIDVRGERFESRAAETCGNQG